MSGLEFYCLQGLRFGFRVLGFGVWSLRVGGLGVRGVV